MKATPFGRFIRKLRIDKGIVLKDLASSLGVSTAHMSALELGKKSISEEVVKEVANYFQLSAQEENELQRLAEISQPQVKIDMKNGTDIERDMVVSFARNYRNMSPEQQKKLKKLMED